VDAIPKTLRLLLASERGATAVEYGLIAALIVIAMMAALGGLGGGVGGMWTELSDTVQNSM
jgi:pilus assembly protein Flp/PilA